MRYVEKVGWLKLPCTIVVPYADKKGARAVFRVKAITRDMNSTTLAGEWVLTMDADVITLDNGTWVQVMK